MGLRKQQIDLLQSLFSPGGFNKLGDIFGQMGSPSTGLQRQSLGGISQFLRQPAPEQRALKVAMPALQNILNGAPGQGMMDALQPHFQQNLAQADQQGGRFGSSNAILRSQAVNDYNLLGAQAYQQGQQSQLQAAQMLNMLSNSAGENPFNRLAGAYGIGQQQAGQRDLETQRRIQLLGTLLGGAQGAAFNIPFTQTSPYQAPLWQQLLNIGGQVLGSATGGK